MPPLIAAVLLGAGAYAGYRLARRLFTADDAGANAQTVQAAPPEKDLGALERDPETGVYRPAAPRT
jgi:hypothetical protein